jgi:two-component system nitrogen regulation response regulator GlnG/two-component system response regulator HydG
VRYADALVVIWSSEGQSRLGECLIIAPGRVRVFGRGADQADDPHPRLHLVRHRPAGVVPAPELDNSHVSRVQWALRALDGEGVQIDNLGLCPLYHNGVSVRTAEVRSGDTVRLGQQLSFVVTRRARDASGTLAGFESVEFGRADGCGIVGESNAIWALRRDLAFLGPRSGHVLIHGASGTGKELVAHAIHRLSPRRGRPLVSRNAATVPEGIVDAELFGNTRNYPNPGMPDRPGLIGQAHESTLFLDEFAELPSSSQTHLLRVLDAGEYQRLGEATARRSDFRLVAATNHPPSDLREDILGRFKFSVELSGLHDRPEDIPLLLRHMLVQIARSDSAVAKLVFPDSNPDADPRLPAPWVEALVRRAYTAHYRELENLLWKALAAERGTELSAGAALGAIEHTAAPASDGSSPPVGPDGEALRPEDIQACLDRHNGAIEQTWRALGLGSRHVLARLISKHGLEVRRSPRRRT